MSEHIESASSIAHQSEQVEYRPIPGFPEYQAGTDGTILKRCSNSTWKNAAISSNCGYFRVSIRGKFRAVHRLVLETFVGPCPEGMQARHFPDRNTANNCLSNLSWNTKSVNERDKIFHGTHSRGEQNSRFKISTEQAIKIRNDYANGFKLSDLARNHNVTPQLIWRIVNRACRTYLK